MSNFNKDTIYTITKLNENMEETKMVEFLEQLDKDSLIKIMLIMSKEISSANKFNPTQKLSEWTHEDYAIASSEMYDEHLKKLNTRLDITDDEPDEP